MKQLKLFPKQKQERPVVKRDTPAKALIALTLAGMCITAALTGILFTSSVIPMNDPFYDILLIAMVVMLVFFALGVIGDMID